MTSSAPHSHFPYGVPGTGNFGRWLGDQDTYSIAVMQDRIMKTIDTVPVDNNTPIFTIGDFGCADAAVSIPLIRGIIDRVRKRCKKNIPIQVVYEDQPTNDFNSVFKRVHGLIPEPPTYLNDFNDVFVMASGTGFFEQILAPNSADVIFSFIAAHYLSVPVTKYKDSLHRFPKATPEECKVVEAQAAKDWETFLLQRARELKSGGVLIVSTPAHDPEGKNDKGVRHWAQHCEEGMLNMWRRMRDEGKITAEEFYDTNMHRCPRYLEEYKAPFASPNSPVRKAGLELISAELIIAPCVAQQQWKSKMEKEGIDDRKQWAQAVVQQHRVWANSNFIRGLSNTRSSGEKEALVDEMFERLEAETAQCDPNTYLNDYLLGYVFARKV
ncbi:uncharacterized protein LOC143295859 isoform X1 [Babylonia areolata]|uniref:uncharacterized protein LOC143295859 isoform X1 n=2 Tax=Babylonia areolata TaxID=304850 RepID=UPI003FCF9544